MSPFKPPETEAVRLECCCGAVLAGAGIGQTSVLMERWQRQHAGCVEAWQRRTIAGPDAIQPPAAEPSALTHLGRAICGLGSPLTSGGSVLLCGYDPHPGTPEDHSWSLRDPWPDRCPVVMQGSRCRGFAPGKAWEPGGHCHWTNEADKPAGFQAPWENADGDAL